MVPVLVYLLVGLIQISAEKTDITENVQKYNLSFLESWTPLDSEQKKNNYAMSGLLPSDLTKISPIPGEV